MSAKDSRTQTYTKSLLLHVLIACIAAFNAGYNIASTNTPASLITKCQTSKNEPIPLEYRKPDSGLAPCWDQQAVADSALGLDWMWGIATALLAVGGLMGGVASAGLATWLGRKYAMMVNNAAFAAGGIVMAVSSGPILMGLGRFIVGFATGSATSYVSMYIGEISTSKLRGTFGACLQLLLVIGIMCATGVGNATGNLAMNETHGYGWRVALGLTALPAILQTVLLFFCVETPRYLASKGHLAEAKVALQRLRGPSHEWNIEGEYRDVLVSVGRYTEPATGGDATKVVAKSDIGRCSEESVAVVDDSKTTDALTLRQIIADPHLRKMLLIAAGIHCAQQITGINCIIMYSTAIFEKVSKDTAELLTLITMFVNFAMTIPSLYLVEILGRKTLMSTGLIGMTVASAMLILGSTFEIPILAIIAVNVFIACFAVGMGPIPWLITSEFVDTCALATVSGVVNFVNYGSNTLVILTFPVVSQALGNYAFVPFLAFSAAFTIFVIVCVPETKGKTPEDLRKKTFDTCPAYAA